jgi:hypothetical protein
MIDKLNKYNISFHISLRIVRMALAICFVLSSCYQSKTHVNRKKPIMMSFVVNIPKLRCACAISYDNYINRCFFHAFLVLISIHTTYSHIDVRLETRSLGESHIFHRKA